MRVEQGHITAILDRSETQEHIFWGKSLVVSYRLPCGFVINGVGSCVDPAEFDIDVGRQVAREDVESKLWELEGYLLQNCIQGMGR